MSEVKRAELLHVRQRIEELRQELAKWEAKERELFNAPDAPARMKKSRS